MKKCLSIILFIAMAFGCVSLYGCGGKHEEPGAMTKSPIPGNVISSRTKAQKAAAENLGQKPVKQILFGDLHVHTTFSTDAFLFSLPLMQGEGSHPPADACDFARFCSALDFWSITDHAESITPLHWKETKETIRQANAVTDPANPDVVAFLGYEWTQISPESVKQHYGHKNVIYRDTEEEKVPPRPITSRLPQLRGIDTQKLFNASFSQRMGMMLMGRLGLTLLDPSNMKRNMALMTYFNELLQIPPCTQDVNTNNLPLDCRETAITPEELFSKLDEGGYESIVIPHGNTWGLYSPPNTTWDKQLTGKMHDPKRQTLFEIYSGHGNSEEYRPWRAVIYDADGNPICPEPSDGYLPPCWRAGEIIAERCLSDGNSQEVCEQRADQARKNFLEVTGMGPGIATVPGATHEDWLNSGQCPDCFLPTYSYRPGGSGQYALAITNFDDPENPKRFRFGFMSSSDVHTARPGTGYKEYARREMTEATGAQKKSFEKILLGKYESSLAYSRPFSEVKLKAHQINTRYAERVTSFLYTGGIAAVHAEGRGRESIWNALKKKEVYGTSGDRILLWFDLVNASDTQNETNEASLQGHLIPMGGETAMEHPPRFHVRAIGAFKQKPGCPDYSVNGLSPERLENLCRNECYNPRDERKLITRIEVIRIRPQIRQDESIEGLIEDVWQTFPCPPNQEGCEVWFKDPEFSTQKRDTVYYVRAIQEPSMAINGKDIRCEYDEDGRCIKVNPCYGSSLRTDYEDDCLAEVEERAWSSPIFVDYKSSL